MTSNFLKFCPTGMAIGTITMVLKICTLNMPKNRGNLSLIYLVYVYSSMNSIQMR